MNYNDYDFPVTRPKKQKLFIAVVMRADNVVSLRSDGSYTSFVDNTKQGAVKRAMAAKDQYESKGSGPYVIYVGQLTQAAKPVERFVLASL